MIAHRFKGLFGLRIAACAAAAATLYVACGFGAASAIAQTSGASGQSGLSASGSSGLPGLHVGSGLGLSGGPMGAPSSLGGIGKSGAGAQSSSGGKPPPTSGRPSSGNDTAQSIGSQLSAGPYANARPGGLYGTKSKDKKSVAAKAQQASAVAAAGLSHEWNYTYGSESLGTNASSIYKSPYKSTTDDYQWGNTTH
ncbi:hypothetical protein [Pararobbsia silviterrae]|nr:hypothetical protein [Pararobbsia silviterrae]